MKSTRAKLLFILFIFIFLVSTAGLISCDKVYDIESVELTSTPAFVENGIELGDSLDFSGVGLKVEYANGVVEYLDLAEVATVSGFQKDVVGEQVITITYTNGTVEKSVSVTVNVRRPKVKSIDIQSTSKNTTYVKGSALDFDGLTAVVTYDKLKNTTDYYTETFNLTADNLVNQDGMDYKYNPDLIGEQTLRFLLYTGVYADLKVKVDDHLVTSVAMYKAPNKTAYAENASIDLTGAQVRLYMNDSATEQVFTIISDGKGGWTLKDFHGTITAKDIQGNGFDSSTVGTYNLYLYYQEDSDSPVLRTGTTVALSVVEKDLKSNGVIFSSALPKQIQNNQSYLQFVGITMTATFNDQTTATYPMTVIYDDTLKIYKGQGFYIKASSIDNPVSGGYDISRPISQDVAIYFYKTVVLEDGSTEYSTTDTYATHFITTIDTLEEAVSAITIVEDNSEQGKEFTRYIDLSNPAVYTFDGYIDDIIPVSQYTFSLIYNSGKEETEGVTLDDFLIEAPSTYFEKVGNDYRLKAAGTTTLVFTYNNIIKRAVNVTIKTATFDNTNTERFVFTSPTKLEYQQGTDTTLSLEGAKAEVYLEYNQTAVKKIVLEGEDLRDCIRNDYDLSVAGKKTITLDYQGAVRTFEITVKSQVSSISLVADNRTRKDFVKGEALVRVEDFLGLEIEVDYATEGVDNIIVDDFTDTSWTFKIDGVDLTTYPLSSGYSANYAIEVYYMGIKMPETLDINVHNYVKSIAMADDNPAYEVVEGIQLDTSNYNVVVTYEDNTTAILSLDNDIFSYNFEYNDLTTGNREVAISVIGDAAGSINAKTSVIWHVKSKEAIGYVLSIKSGVTLDTITVSAPIDKDDFILLQHFNNGTSDTTTFQFSTYDTSTVPEGGSQDFEVYVLVNGEEVDFDFNATDNMLSLVDGTLGKKALSVKVVFDIVTSVTFSAGGTMVEVKEGYDFADLSPISTWSLDVEYQQASGIITFNVADGAFHIEDYDRYLVGVQAVTLVSDTDPNVKIKFNVNVIEKVLLTIEAKGSLKSMTEGMPLTNDIFINAYLLATYDNGTQENISIFVNSTKMSVTGYDKDFRIDDNSASKDKELTVLYAGKSALFTLTLLKREIVGIKIDPKNMPKDEYRELEDFAIVDGTDYLATDKGTIAKLYLVCDNGDLISTAGVIGDATDITRDMLVTEIGDFNKSDLTTNTVVPVTISYQGFSTTFNIWLYDRLSIKVDREEFDSNRYIYYYGETPVVNYTLRYFTSASDTVGTIAPKGILSFVSQSNIIYKPQYSGTTFINYIVENGGSSSIAYYLPVGSYTVVISCEDVKHTADTIGLNAYENTEKVLTVINTPLKTGFDENHANISIVDGQYLFSDIYGNNVAGYDKAFFQALVTYAHCIDNENYKNNFVEGDIKAQINTAITIEDSDGNNVELVKNAGMYTLIVQLSDKEGSQILSNYAVTTYQLSIVIAPKEVEVQFYNSLDPTNSNRIFAVYGSAKEEIGSDYYIVNGLVGNDTLDGALYKDSIGSAEIGSEIVRNDYEVGYYGIQIGTLNNPNYTLIVNSQDGVYFDDVYYVVTPAPITIKIDDKQSFYGNDGKVYKGAEEVGTISVDSQLFAIDNVIYSFFNSTVYIDIVAGQINTADNSFIIDNIPYTYEGSNIKKNGVTQTASNISTINKTITLGSKDYFYFDDGTIYEKRGTISTVDNRISVDNVSYTFVPKADVSWSITLSSSDNKYNDTYSVALIDGKFVDTVTGLGIEFDVLFNGGTRPTNVGTYPVSLNGSVDAIDLLSYNYFVQSVSAGNYEIIKKTITVTPIVDSKIYDNDVSTNPHYEYILRFAEVSDLKNNLITGNISREQGEEVGQYLYTEGDLYNPNYYFDLEEVYFTIFEREIFMEFSEEAITKEYDGLAPSIDFREKDFTLYYLDEGGSKILWDVDLVITDDYDDQLIITFAQALPGCGKYAMTLTENDHNHKIVLAEEYSYTIKEKPLEISFMYKLAKQEDVEGNWKPLAQNATITYSYDNPIEVKAVAVGVVQGEEYITIGDDLVNAPKVGSYKATATTINGSNNYKFSTQSPSIDFSIVRKNIYVYVSSANLTQDYFGNSAIRINNFEIYEEYENQSSKVAIDATEGGVLAASMTFTIGDGSSSSWTQNGYVVKINLSAEHNVNYTINMVSDKSFSPTSFDSNGEYVKGYGGMQGNSLVYIINKQETIVDIIATNLSKEYDSYAPSIRGVSVEPHSIVDKVLNALIFKRLTTPYGESVDNDDTDYGPADVGAFQVTINNATLTGDAANYYCVLESSYVYEIKERPVTITLSQGTAQNIYRRYNGKPLTHADVLDSAAIDGVTRTISIVDYRPLSVTSPQDIIATAGLKFVFTNLNAINVGSYKFYAVADDYNHKFSIYGADENGLSTFEIRRNTLDIAISNNIYRYYHEDTYYDGENQIGEEGLAGHFEINTQVYVPNSNSVSVSSAIISGKLTIAGEQYFVIGPKLFKVTPIEGVYASINSLEVIVGKTSYDLSYLNGDLFEEWDTEFYINNNSNTIHAYAGTIDDATSATLVGYQLQTLTKDVFSGLSLETDLGYNDTARIYTGRLKFNIVDTFEDIYPNYSLPGLSSRILEIKPKQIPVTITSTDSNGDPLEKQYGNYISEIEKQLLTSGKINYEDIEGVVYSGTIDSSTKLIEIYFTRYYYIDNDIFLIVGDIDLVSNRLVINDKSYIIDNNQLYRIYGSFAGDLFNIDNTVYYIKESTIYQRRYGDGITTPYTYAVETGSYDGNYILLNSVDTIYQVRGSDIVAASAVGEMLPGLNSINIDGDRYSYIDGYVFSTAGTIDAGTQVITIGNTEYIYVANKVFNVVGHYDNDVFTIERQTYAVENNNLYINETYADGEYNSTIKYFTVGSTEYVYDANGKVYDVVGALVSDDKNDKFDLLNSRYYYQLNGQTIYRVWNEEGGYSSPYNDTSNYYIDTVSKTIVFNGVRYTYLDSGHIRAVAGSYNNGNLTIDGTEYTIDGTNTVWSISEGVAVGTYDQANSIVTVGDKEYNIQTNDLYEIVGGYDDTTVTVKLGKYVIVDQSLYRYRGYFDSVNSKITIGDTLQYKLSGRYVFYDTEISVGTYEDGIFTLGADTYHIIDNIVFTTQNTYGSISIEENEFQIGNTKYIFATSQTKTKAFNTEQVTFTYYTLNTETGEYVEVPMANTQAVGEYYFTVNFHGNIANTVDGQVYYGNYVFVSNYGSISIAKAPINVTLSGNKDWVYRQNYVDTEDFTRANISEIVNITQDSCAMDIPFDVSSIIYPVLTDTARAYFDNLATTDQVGKTYTLTAESFDQEKLSTINSNYIFNITGSATITVVSRKLNTSVVKIDGNTITKSITKDYGVLPEESELAILYTGFSSTEFANQADVFDTAVYYNTTNTWYIVYNYSQNADENRLEEATATQTALLNNMITTKASLPNFYIKTFVKDGRNYVDLYDAGVTNKIKVTEDCGFVSQNYAVLPVDNFTFVVNPVNLTLTLEPVDANIEITKVYGENVIMGTDYEIIFSDTEGNRIITSIVINGVTYYVDTAQSLFFDQRDADYNWLVYDNRVNMTNTGSSISGKVYLSLGKAADPSTGAPATSKFEDLTSNYILSYVDKSIEIQIYNKIDSISVGEGALYSAVVGDNPFIPITVTYKDGTKLDTLKYYLDPSITNMSGLTMGEGDDFKYVIGATIGNQVVKITYEEINYGVLGGKDIESVYITLRTYNSADTKKDNTDKASDNYKKFSYVTYMSGDIVSITNLASIDGVMSLDSDGDGVMDLYFLMVAIDNGSFTINDVEYTYSGTTLTSASGSINYADKTITVDGTTYYFSTEINAIKIYQSKVENTLMGYVGAFSLAKYVYAQNINKSSAVEVFEVPAGIADTQEFVLDGSVLGFANMGFVPSNANNVEIRLIKSHIATVNYKNIETNISNFDISDTSAISLDANGDNISDYYLMFATVGKIGAKMSMLYIYKNGDPTDKFVTISISDDEVLSLSTGAIGTLADISLDVLGNNLEVVTTLKVLDKGYSTAEGGSTYSFGDFRTVSDGLTHEYKLNAEGEYDKLQMEFSLQPIYGKSGEFNFVVFSYRNSQNKIYELSIRLLTGAQHKAMLYVIESIDGNETIAAYETYRSVAVGSTGTYFDLLDGKTHHIDVYVNRLSCELTIIIDGAMKLNHSLFADTGIDVSSTMTIPDIAFPLEDYSDYYDGDKVYSTTRVKSTAYFTVKNMTFNISSMAYITMGYYNEMAIILTPSDTAETVLYVNNEDPLRPITLGEYFTIYGNYFEGTTLVYYINGVRIENEARRVWLEEGIYCLTAQIFIGDTMLAEADFYLTIAIEDEEEKIADEDVSYTAPVTIAATTQEVFNGNTQKHYNYYRTEFMLSKLDNVVYDGSVYNIILNIKANDNTVSAFTALSNEYIGLSLGVKIAENQSTTDLLLKVKGKNYTVASTTNIDWLATVDGNYIVEAYMDDYNHIIVVTIYRAQTKLHTFTIKKDDLNYSTSNIYIETENAISGYTERSGHIVDFIDAVGSQSIILTNMSMVLFDMTLNTDCDIRQSLYLVDTGSSGADTSLVFNSSINPTKVQVSSDQYASIMLGNGSNVPYAMEYNSYSTQFSVKRQAGGAARVRFIIAENIATDVDTMFNSHKKVDNFTSTRAITLVYEDDGNTASMYFMFMLNGMSNVYRQYVYANLDNSSNDHVLSYGEGEPETVHSISVNIFKTPESVSVDGLFTTSNITVMYVQIIIDGQIYADANGIPKNFYFPYYNSVAFWTVGKDINGNDMGTATSADAVNINDKYFLNQYTMAGVVFNNCEFSLYNMQVAKADTLEVTEQYILDIVKGGNANATNFYYYDYFADLYGLGGAYLKRTYGE